MKIKDSNEIEQLIEQLDFQIFAGYSGCVGIKTSYNEQKTSENFNIDKFIDEAHKILSDWHSGVVEILHSRLGSTSHFLYHFVRSVPTAFHYTGMPQNLSNVIVRFEKHLEALENVIMRLEEREGLLIRQEIAKQEYDSSHRYWLRYDDIAGKLYLNGSILIASTRLDSPADRLLQQAFAKPDNLIELDGITSTQVSSALRDLNIKGSLKKLFFPRTSGNKIFFRPFITNAEFVKEEHKDIRITDFMRNNEK